MRTLVEYRKFLENKIKSDTIKGFEVSDDELNPNLFEFQKFCIKKALKASRFCLFEDCGLGKTLQQLSWAQVIKNKTKQSVLILAPLAVVDQTIREGVKFGIRIRDFDSYNNKVSIYITNYEQLHLIDTSIFSGIVLDESSILKNFNGALRNLIIDKFKSTPYKLACSATPSPNDPMELGNHSEFLGIMSRSEMLSMYFVHDGGTTSLWRLKGHAEYLFWEWVSNWAIMISKPSDIGFSDDDYILHALNMIEIPIITEKINNGRLFNDIAVNATNFNAELRRTQEPRMSKTAELVNNSNENFIVWIKQNKEAQLLKTLIPDAVEVSGNESNAIKKAKLLGFANNEFRVLITKQKIAQYGLNYQNCHNQVFASLDFSFESFYQAVRRSYRYGQSEAVNIYLLVTDTMGNVKKSIQKKKSAFESMQKNIILAMEKIANNKTPEVHRIEGDNNLKIKLPTFLK